MKKQAFIYIILAGILWGTSGIFVHYLSPHGFSSLQMTAVRGVVSLICMALYALFTDRSLFKVRWQELIMFAAIGASLFFTASCYYSSMQMTSVSTAVVLMYTAPIYVMVFSVLFLGEKLSPMKLVAVGCMLVGCSLVAGIIGGVKFDLLGIIIGVLSGIAYASYNILTKISMRGGSRPVSATVYSFLFMSIIAICVCKPDQIVNNAAKSPAVTIPLLLGLGICTFVLPYLFYTLAMKTLPAGTASALAIVEPMAATLFSVILFDELLDLFSIIGIVLILLAVFLLGYSDNKINKNAGDKK